MHNEVQSPDTYIGHLMGLLKTKLPATVFSFGVAIAQMLSNPFYELFLPGALADKLASLGKENGATTGSVTSSAVTQREAGALPRFLLGLTPNPTMAWSLSAALEVWLGQT